MKHYNTMGVIGRFRPLHNGSAGLLEFACKNSNHVIIGIGSSNKYDVRCPFTAKETKAMIDAILKHKYTNYRVVFIKDFGHIPKYADGKRWAQEIKEQFGDLDVLVSGNPYVKKLMEASYRVIEPQSIIPKQFQNDTKGTMVRVCMATNANWEELVPVEVKEYLEKKQLVKRFQVEFGKQTLLEYNKHPEMKESASREQDRITQ